MPTPDIELIPLCPALQPNCPIVLDLVIKVIPPQLDPTAKRPSLNLGLVIDRSSSMSVKDRLVYAKASARQILQDLLPSDRISITTFDRTVQTLVPSTLVMDKMGIIEAIQSIQTGKWTNLHAGWVEGGNQVHQHLYPGMMNRIILLSDGWASAGVRNLAEIIADVQGMAQSGISTTTVGVGNDYNEDWLQAMAVRGDGNYYYVNSPDRLPTVFQQEMQALLATVGLQVDLGIEPQNGVDVVEILNDLPVTSLGRFKLPNLVVGYPFSVVVRLNVPALSHDTDLCNLRLSWLSPDHTDPQILRVPFRMPIAQETQAEDLPRNPEVQQAVALMKAARAKKAAIAAVDRHDYTMALMHMMHAKSIVLKAPPSAAMAAEVVAIESLENSLRARQLLEFRKRSHYEVHEATTGFSQPLNSQY